MKAEDSIHPTLESTQIQGIDLLTHMSIEFTKALLMSSDWDRNQLNDDYMKITTVKAKQVAKELIKQLNEEK